MKAFLTTTIAFCLFTITCSAQNTSPFPSTGNVGIGTTTPATFLEVLSTSAGTGIRASNSTAAGNTSGGGLLAVLPASPTASGQRLGLLGFGGIYVTTPSVGYRYPSNVSGFSSEAWSSTNTGSYLTFGTTPNGTINVVERMRIDNAGNVGIGTTAPSQLLEIAGASGLDGSTTPTVKITSTNNSAAWTVGANYAQLDFSNNDISGLGAGAPKARIAAIIDEASGTSSDMTFSTANGTALRENMRIMVSGNVGIGNTTPGAPLHLGGGTAFTLRDGTGTAFTPQLINSQASGVAGMGVAVMDGTNNRRIGLFVDQPNGIVGISTYYSSGNPAFVFRNPTAGEVYRITPAGNMGLGTSTPDQKLSVNGNVHAKSMIVDLNGLGDYVFYSNYYLPSLESVKAYVDKNHHLQDVPTAAEVEKSGMNLGDMNKVLLKKVEELTLYMIDLNKQLKAQQKEIKRLKAKK